MITIINGKLDELLHEDLMSQMFGLRARSFSDRRRWSVTVRDGQERDDFDDLNPIYLIATCGTEAKRVLGSLRLLSTVGPHMLADVFPETLGAKQPIRDPLVWESTRFCVDTDLVLALNYGGIGQVTGELLTALFELAHNVGITQILSVYDLFLERILRNAGCSMTRISDPVEYDGLKTVAGVFEVSEAVVQRIRTKARLRSHHDVFRSGAVPVDRLRRPVTVESLQA